MVDFRRWAIAMALLVAIAGLASAQTTPQTCQTNVAVTPTLRSEGYTEQTGDITITCTGGANIGVGSLIPQVNIALFYNSQVTSRLIPQGSVGNISEALLLLDDPGAAPGVGSQYGTTSPGYGTAALQTLCTSPTTGCTATVGTVVVGPGGVASAVGTAVAVATANGTTTAAAANVFQGIVAGNSITFFGIPILAPVTSGFSRTIRITNARVNASSLGGSSASGATPVIASISISGATSLLISNATPTVGFVQGGLSSSASGSSNRNQCSSDTLTSVNTLTFSENFPTAFKTRVSPQTNNSYAGQAIPGAAPNNQNIPGTIYNSESNFVFPVPGGTAGLSDFGTRLKATFNNVPAGVRIFVSTANVNNNASPVQGTAGAPTVIGGTATTTYAQLVNSETVSDGNAGISGFFPSVSGTTFGPNGGNVPIAEITVLNGSATATWEIVNTNPNGNESLKFAVYETFSSNVAQNTPPPGTATVTMSYAPTPPAFSASSGAAASSTLTIPRFTAGTGSSNIFTINICRTILLYPYVTNIQGFDTGLAIANTTTDPFGTGAQAGSCDLNWYQGTNNPAKGTSGTIASGTIYTTLASTAVPGFNGYMIAVCNFQFAHGFAFVSDVGARNLAMGYLAVVIADPGSGSRLSSPGGCIGVSGCNTAGEQGGH